MTLLINRAHGVLGVIVILLLAVVLSKDRQHINIRATVLGLGVQLLVALLIFRLPYIKTCFSLLTVFVKMLEAAMHHGVEFLFGYLGGAEMPFEPNDKGSTFILALQALPLLILMSALSALLFYWRILPIIIGLFSRLFEKSLHIGGALGLGSAANIFFGIDSAPMVIRPYLKTLSQSELFSFMSVSMATVSGSVMVVYPSLLNGLIDDVIGHVLAASLISIPAAITIARIIIPDLGKSTAGQVQHTASHRSAIDAIAQGTMDGVTVYINVIAMIMCLVALVSLANSLLTILPFSPAITLQDCLGFLLRPLVWLIGLPWHETQQAGVLLATKTILNEMVAYIDLSQLPANTFAPRSRLILIYALCGFANISSIGVVIGTIGTLVPERRSDVVDMGVLSLVAGFLATLLTGAVVSIVS